MTTTAFQPIDDYEFCHEIMRHFGYKGNVLNRSEVGKFLTDYLVEQGYKTRWGEYAKILCLPVLTSTKTVQYITQLKWLLGMIIAANSMVLKISVIIPECEK
ncbi:hypothetical protein [Nostoc sp.]|uniref:hypothetical protein n=1 Tax=Nostoc sp. TaxID=1180 RepID=UPI002FFC7803